MNKCVSIATRKLIAHPDNPNRMSKANFAKLVRNIEKTGRYEPLIVRPHPKKKSSYQIINGHHRCDAIVKLGCEKADCIVWDIDDAQTDILLATLNRLCGVDTPAKKIALIKKLRDNFGSKELAKLLPNTARQIEKLSGLAAERIKLLRQKDSNAKPFAHPLVFFVTDEQKEIIAAALDLAGRAVTAKTNAAKRAAALMNICKSFINHKSESRALSVSEGKISK